MAKRQGGTRKRRVVHDAHLFVASPPQPDTDIPTELVTLKRDSSSEGLVVDGSDEVIIDGRSVEACPTCDSLEFWWNCKDERRCQRCDPPVVRFDQLIADAAILRSKADKSRLIVTGESVSP